MGSVSEIFAEKLRAFFFFAPKFLGQSGKDTCCQDRWRSKHKNSFVIPYERAKILRILAPGAVPAQFAEVAIRVPSGTTSNKLCRPLSNLLSDNQ
jgi:hypothetical protein